QARTPDSQSEDGSAGSKQRPQGGFDVSQATHDLDVRDHLRGCLHGDARQSRRHDGAAGDPPRPARVDREPRVDGERVHAHLRRAPAHRCGARRPLWAAPHARDRPLHLHCVVRRRSARPYRRCAHRSTRRAGRGRRDRDAADADDPQRRRARKQVFTLANVASLLMFFGMFGSIFLLSQFFQTVQGYSPVGSGLRILPWTIMPMFVAPIAGALSDRIGGARLMGAGLTLQATGLASIAALSTPTTPYWQLVAPFMVSGIGMAMFWAPVANVVLAAV